MRKREVERFRRELEGRLATLVGHGERTIGSMAGAEMDEVPDPNDRASIESERNWSLRLADRDRKLIEKVQRALARIGDGTFGTCEVCGRAIDSARMRARPVTTLCIACKTESERRDRRS